MMVKRKVITPYIFLLFIASASAFSDDLPRMLVLDFQGSGLSDEELSLFGDYVTSHILETGVYRLVSQTQRDAAIEEMKFSLEGHTRESEQIELGRMLLANYLLVGSLGEIGDRFLLNMKLVDVETAETIRSVSESYSSMEAIIDDSERISRLLVDVDDVEEDARHTSDETVDNTQRHPRQSNIDDTKKNTVSIAAFWESDYGELFVGLRYSRLLLQKLGLNAGTYVGAQTIALAFDLGSFYDFGWFRTALDLGFDLNGAIFAGATFSAELNRIVVAVYFGLDDFFYPRLGISLGWQF